jgi:hypothetical protein
MRPALDPAGHRVPRVTLLVSPLLGGPARHRPFAPTLHLHQRKSSLNLHLQYSAKSQSTPHCQSLITARSDHPPVLRCFGPQPPQRCCLASRGGVFNGINFPFVVALRSSSRRSRAVSFLLGGYPKNSDYSPNTRERERNTFKH